MKNVWNVRWIKLISTPVFIICTLFKSLGIISKISALAIFIIMAADIILLVRLFIAIHDGSVNYYISATNEYLNGPLPNFNDFAWPAHHNAGYGVLEIIQRLCIF